MITPRRTRLLRASDLSTYRRGLVDLAVDGDPWAVRARAVIVPTRAAASLLRQSAESALPPAEARRVDGRHSALAWPYVVTRDEWYGVVHARLRSAPRRLTPFECDVMMRAAADEAVRAGTPPPFRLRPGLITQVVDFYDTLRRLGRSVTAFERVMVGELAPSAEFDRGADRMLRQTRFLLSTLEAYERRVAASGLLDEHALRARAVREAPPHPLQHVVVAVGDYQADPYGLWPADFDLIARAPGVASVDLVATDRLLSAGLYERLHDRFPGLEESRLPERSRGEPVLVVPEGGSVKYFTSRDREAELLAVASVVKAWRRDGTLDGRAAVVLQRPLPYLYLAPHVLARAGVPFRASASLPLATEPFAATLDLTLEAVTSEFARAALNLLLRSPHLHFESGDGNAVAGVDDLALLDQALRDARYLGGAERLRALVASQFGGVADTRTSKGRALLRAGRLAVAVVDELAAFQVRAQASVILEGLRRFIELHSAPHDGLPVDARTEAARSAVLAVMGELRDAHRRHGDPVCDLVEVATSLRRWIETRAIGSGDGRGGLQLIDPATARYGEFRDVFVVGLIEREWPERRPRSVFYPVSLLRHLGWPSEAEQQRAARAAFDDLLRLPHDRLVLSTFTLEDDAVVAASPLLEGLAETDTPFRSEPAGVLPQVSADEALSRARPASWIARGEAADWLSLRRSRLPLAHPAFHGRTDGLTRERYAVTAVERYLECPFRHFAADVLRLRPEPEDELAIGPRQRGEIVHEVLRRFFERWIQRHRGPLAAHQLAEAKTDFAEIADGVLARVPEPDRALERARLLGSAASPGIGDRLLRLEAERSVPVLEYLVEHPLEGSYQLWHQGSWRSVTLRGVADRIDLQAGGSLRIVDYKLGRAPRPGRAIQLAIYGACAEQQLRGYRGQSWQLTEATYLGFGDPVLETPVAKPGALREALLEGQQRFVAAMDAMAGGQFPPRPDTVFRCVTCAFSTVCRKEYVDAG